MTDDADQNQQSRAADTRHFDVLVVGAGISGIGAAYHLNDKCPDRSFAILEGRAELGGTWSLFRYPGVRSDSDMHTLGYSFKPWKNPKSIADGPSILEYLKETVAEHDIERHIRYNHLVSRAEWSSAESQWTLTVNHAETGETLTYTGNFLFMCSGYYSYKGGYEPEFVGSDDFNGTIVHPQKWPADLDHTGKKVAVIGSGATAMTIVPAMAKTAEHVTMIQRSPTYVVARPDEDPVAKRFRQAFSEETAYKLTRRKNVFLSQLFYRQTRTNPEKVKEQLLTGLRKSLDDEMGPDFVSEHFTPSYNPWDQRLCLIPNADLLESLKARTSSVRTAHIDRFVPDGVRLDNGDVVEADVIVTATGLQLVTLGEMDFFVDGEQVDFSKVWTYKGLSYSGVPNLVSSFGYINASWTLRADITCTYVCRVVNHLAESATTQYWPMLRPQDADMPERPWIDDFSSGYMQRMMANMPRQGDREPWINTQSYNADLRLIMEQPVDDDAVVFCTAEDSPALDAREAASV